MMPRLDVRTRMAVCLAASLGVVVVESLPCLLILSLVSLVYALAHGRIKILAAVLSGVGLMFVMAMVCVYIMSLFWPEFGAMGMGVFVNPFLRVLVLAHTIVVLAVSSRVQDVMTSLKTLGLPFFIFLPAAVMVRFVPEFINDVKLIRESMRIKGFHTGILSVTLHPFLLMRLLLMPLTIRALRSADTLAVAAELKGMDGRSPMTRAASSGPGFWDILVLASALVLILGSILAEHLA